MATGSTLLCQLARALATARAPDRAGDAPTSGDPPRPAPSSAAWPGRQSSTCSATRSPGRWSATCRAIPDLDIRDRTMLGCGVARTGPYRYFGQTYEGVGPDCRELARDVATRDRRRRPRRCADPGRPLGDHGSDARRAMDATSATLPSTPTCVRNSSWRSRRPARTARKSCWRPSRTTAAASSSTAACTPRTSPSASPPGTLCSAKSRPTTRMSESSTSAHASHPTESSPGPPAGSRSGPTGSI